MHRRKQALGTNELVPAGARRAGKRLSENFDSGRENRQMLGQQCCAGGLCEDAPGSGEIYPQRGISPKDPSERIQRLFESTGTSLSSAPGLSSLRPSPNLTNWRKPASPRKLGFWEHVLSGREPMKEGTRKQGGRRAGEPDPSHMSVSYTHLRAHETRHDIVCRLLLEKKKKT